MASKLSKLENLRSRMPVYNPTAAARSAATRTAGLQQAVAATPAGARTTQVAQNVGTALATQAGQQAVGQAGQAAQNRVQQAQVQLSQRQRALKQEALNERLDFARDESGRALMNQRQMADFVKANTADEQEFQRWAQQAQQAQKLKLLAMQTAEQAIQQKLQTMAQRELNAYEQKQMTDLQNYLGDMQEAIVKQQAESAKAGATWAAGGAVLGAVAGSTVGAPVAGAALGSSAGTLAHSQFKKDD